MLACSRFCYAPPPTFDDSSSLEALAVAVLSSISRAKSKKIGGVGKAGGAFCTYVCECARNNGGGGYPCIESGVVHIQLDRIERKRWRYCTRSKYGLITHSHFPKKKDNTAPASEKERPRIGLAKKNLFLMVLFRLFFLNFSIIVG